MANKTKVLICVDPSQNASLAFDHYVEHLHKPGNKVIVLHVSGHVMMPSTTYLYSDDPVPIVDFNQQEIVDARDQLKKENADLQAKFEGKCDQTKIVHQYILASEGPDGVGQTIVDEAKKHNVNLIVIGSRGLGVIRRTILGSTSDYVVHHCHIPTVVCPIETP